MNRAFCFESENVGGCSPPINRLISRRPKVGVSGDDAGSVVVSHHPLNWNNN